MSYDLIGKTKLSRLEQRALREGWAISDEENRQIVARQVEIATTASNRQATSATRCLLTMNSQDLRRGAEEPVEEAPAHLNLDPGALSAVIQARMAAERNAKLPAPERKGAGVLGATKPACIGVTE